MKPSSTYETDILEWSEQQASTLRALAQRRRDLPNELDLEHIAEEIEDVGRSEFLAAQSLVRQIFIHVIKAVSAPDATSVAHWRSEVAAFHGDLLDRMTPSMRSRLDLAKLWQRARKQAELDLSIFGQSVSPVLPRACPLGIEALVEPDFDLFAAVDIVRREMTTAGP